MNLAPHFRARRQPHHYQVIHHVVHHAPNYHRRVAWTMMTVLARSLVLWEDAAQWFLAVFFGPRWFVFFFWSCHTGA